MPSTARSGSFPSLSKRAIEWPTWLLIAAIYGSWFGLIAQQRALNPLLVNVALTLVVAWFMSLQHELLHGHPTRSQRFNRWLGLAPLAVWYPYDIYRQSHLAHHQETQLTYPGIDPESNYLAPAEFDHLPRWLQPPQTALRTAPGRVLLGPAFAVIGTWREVYRQIKQRDYTHLRIWLAHIGMLVVMLWALDYWFGFSPIRYLLAVAYPALGLAMLRSFYEHRPAAIPAHRVVINEAGWFWRLLYLNNNFHLVHHEAPQLAWYRIPAAYRADRAGFLARNGGFLLPGYGYLLWHFAFKAVDAPTYPALRVSI